MRIIKPLKFPRLRAIGLTQQAVARRQHSSTALCGTADSLHSLAEYSRNHSVPLALPHANRKYAGLASASVTKSTRKKTDLRSLSLLFCAACSPRGRMVPIWRQKHSLLGCTACSLRGRLCFDHNLSTLSSAMRRARHEAALWYSQTADSLTDILTV